ncbi:MAG TPA: DUF3105 domain-containing protein [Solirubrobacteraceae bacterium]|nr:DUF3105 domain-containing protein [Solirubrobacteraceae bacterium]
MASRQEEKERRRAERLAAEAADNAAKSRTRRVQLALGGLLAIAVVIGIAIAVAGGGGDDSASGDGPSSSAASTVAIPAASNGDLESAAKAAGCTLRSPAIQGSTHVTTKVTYGTNPPTSGNHNPEPALDGIYAPGNTPTPEHFVHALEHGRIEFQYKPGTSARRIAQLETLASEPLNGKDAYKVLLFENNTNMPYAVAATAWGQMITCKTFNAKTFDALRDFRVKYVDKGPEQGIPPNN